MLKAFTVLLAATAIAALFYSIQLLSSSSDLPLEHEIVELHKEARNLVEALDVEIERSSRLAQIVPLSNARERATDRIIKRNIICARIYRLVAYYNLIGEPIKREQNLPLTLDADFCRHPN